TSPMMNPSIVQQISECFVKPQQTTEESKQPCYLTPWDLTMLSVQYIEKGLLFKKPPATHNQEDLINTLLDKLKQSLSLTLVHFYPLADHLAKVKNENPPAYSVFVDCNNNPAAKFIHATLHMTISDILSPVYVPLVVQSLFDHDGALNIDGHTRPLLSIQVTELADGIFIGCSMNHSLADGSSYRNFFNAWSEIFQAQEKSTLSISHQPINQCWFLDGHGPMINLPFKHQ
ncbi:Transferase domain-containing protein, partial [Cephalotus follicularis]